MTNGDKIKLRAELAGKAMQGLLSDQATMAAISKDANRLNVSPTAYLGSASAEYADAVMAALGLSIED